MYIKVVTLKSKVKLKDEGRKEERGRESTRNLIPTSKKKKKTSAQKKIFALEQERSSLKMAIGLTIPSHNSSHSTVFNVLLRLLYSRTPLNSRFKVLGGKDTYSNSLRWLRG